MSNSEMMKDQANLEAILNF